MKKLVLVTALLGLGALSLPSQATTATGNFDVTISLTSACKITTSAATTAAFSYTSLQTSASPSSSSFQVLCTKSLPITSIQLDGSGTYTDQATDLSYTLTLGTFTTPATGAVQNVSITGSMPANQVGTCGAATCDNGASTNKQRTLTITY